MVPPRFRFWITSGVLAGLIGLLGYGASSLYGSGAFEQGGPAWLLMLAIALGTFVSEDLSTITSGLLAASGRLSYMQAVAAAFSGIFVGDLIIFWLGFHFGRPFLRHRWSRLLVSERSVNRAQQHFHKNGAWLIFLSRFLPGTRSATYFAAGALHAPFHKFVGVFALAAAAWTPLLVGLSFYLGRELLDLYEVYEALALPALILAGLVLYIIFHYGLPLATWKGRRRLIGKWIRATRWEYWPWWQIYGPVILYIFWLGFFRYRQPTLFTAVNPCMPDGGFIGESKSDILTGLKEAGEALPKWASIPRISGRDRLHVFLAAMASRQLDYPVVLKPDTGQRGTGVKVIRNQQQAETWLEENASEGILQDYVAGHEYGIFYMRQPGDGCGRITSITIKEQLRVTGNGIDDLETLIYRHPRAVVLLKLFLDRFETRLNEVPPDGEVIPLGELGTHSRGSLFLDGSQLSSPQLVARMDQIARTYRGFYFGRFDIKAPSAEALMQGEGLRIIELNGVTSEETHIYDPKYGIINAWRTLCRQWRAAFRIAEANVARGNGFTPLGEFVKHLLSSVRPSR